MRRLKEIQHQYLDVKDLDEPVRTLALVKLMDELEWDYHTFIIDPTPGQLKRASVKLYQRISAARVFT